MGRNSQPSTLNRKVLKGKVPEDWTMNKRTERPIGKQQKEREIERRIGRHARGEPIKTSGRKKWGSKLH